MLQQGTNSLFIDGRLDELEELLKQAVVINGGGNRSIVKLGSTVTLHVKGKKRNLYGGW